MRADIISSNPVANVVFCLTCREPNTDFVPYVFSASTRPSKTHEPDPAWRRHEEMENGTLAFPRAQQSQHLIELPVLNHENPRYSRS